MPPATNYYRYHRERMSPAQVDAENAQQRDYRRARQTGTDLAAVGPEFDPGLLKPVAFQPPPMSDAERARLNSELGCLHRERDATQRGIDYLLQKLAV